MCTKTLKFMTLHYPIVDSELSNLGGLVSSEDCTSKGVGSYIQHWEVGKVFGLLLLYFHIETETYVTLLSHSDSWALTR